VLNEHHAYYYKDKIIATLLITYSTSAWVTLARGIVSTKTLYSLINAICLNNKMRNYLIKKAESSLLFLRIIITNSKASNALVRHLTSLI
jgi:hypothetical protein